MNTEKPLQDAVKHHIDEKDALNRKAQAANCAATVLADECGKLRKRVAELERQVETLQHAAAQAIPSVEHPAEKTADNWAWQIINLGDDRRCVYVELATAQARIAELETELRTVNQHLSQSVEDCEHHRVTEALKARIEKLEAQLAESRKDSERLDWMEGLNQWPIYHDGLWFHQETTDAYDTLRAAIDAAKEGGAK